MSVDPKAQGPRISNDEINDKIAEYLSKGGKINRFKEDDGNYDKAEKKLEKRLGGLIRPFSKEDALSTD
jgi:hypothetical protein